MSQLLLLRVGIVVFFSLAALLSFTAAVVGSADDDGLRITLMTLGLASGLAGMVCTYVSRQIASK